MFDPDSNHWNYQPLNGTPKTLLKLSTAIGFLLKNSPDWRNQPPSSEMTQFKESVRQQCVTHGLASHLGRSIYYHTRVNESTIGVLVDEPRR